MKSLNELTRDELLNFIVNYPPGNINVYDKLAGCAACGKDGNDCTYYYVCDDCDKDDLSEQ